MKVLIACEYSGAIRSEFHRLGHMAVSCDILPSEEPWYGFNPWHYEGDVKEIFENRTRPFYKRLGEMKWDLVIAHPPCTYLCSSGLHWNKRRPERAAQTEAALEFIKYLWELPVAKLAIENPTGCINTRLPFMPLPQYVQPHWFGDDASKKTGFWTRGLPALVPTKKVPGRKVIHNGKEVERWANQTDSGQNKLGPSEDRWKERSTTYPGLARAVAEQWGAV